MSARIPRSFSAELLSSCSDPRASFQFEEIKYYIFNIGSTFFAITSVTMRQGNSNLEEFRPIETKSVNSTEQFDAK